MKNFAYVTSTFNISVWMCIISNIQIGDTGSISNVPERISSRLYRLRRQTDCDGCSSLPPVNSVTPISTSGNKRPPTVTEQESCVLPSNIQNGRWKILGNSTVSDYRPGDRVITNTVLIIECRRGFKMNEATFFILCNAGNWLPRVPECVKTCPKLESSTSTLITCTNEGINVNCSEAVSYTLATFSCAPFHEMSTIYNKMRCLDGSWDAPRPVCTPVCGQKNNKIQELIGSYTVRQGSNPWNVALYRKKDKFFDHLCGASLISEKLIVTAAHCVTNREGKKYSEDIYRVAAGKYYRAYDDVRDTDAQFSEVEKIFVHDHYRGATLDFESDIAVLVAKTSFKTTRFVQRVCVDWNSNLNYENGLPGRKGEIVGWGYTVGRNEPSSVLKEISLSYVNFTKCFDAMPDVFKRYIKSDKMCAEVLDKDIGVCVGDSGGGFTFFNNEKNRYYLRGIVSVNPNVDGKCNSSTLVLSTKVSSYIDFIKSIDVS